MAEGKAIPLSHSRHALACIKLASTTITRLQSDALAMPDVLLSWDTTYTLFLAIMCLVFLISAHNGTSRPSEAWKRCETGIRLLTKNACTENCATTCLNMLKEVVRQLNHTVDFDFDSIQDTTGRICAPTPSPRRSVVPHSQELDAWSSRAERRKPSVLTGLTGSPSIPAMPSPLLQDQPMNVDAILAHAEDLAIGIDLEAVLRHGNDGSSTPLFFLTETNDPTNS